MKKLILIMGLSFLVFATFITAKIPSRAASDEWFTIYLKNAKSTSIERPERFINSDEIYKGLTFKGTIVSDRYDVTCNLNSVKLVKEGDLVTQIKVKRSEASKLVVNISPRTSPNKITCNKFMNSDEMGYSTAKEASDYDRNNPGVEYFSMRNSYPAETDTYANASTYHYTHFISFSWVWDPTNSYVGEYEMDGDGKIKMKGKKVYPLKYLVSADSGYSGLCIKDIKNADKDTINSITIPFSIYKELSVSGSGSNSFTVAGNGTSNGSRSNYKSNVYLTNSAVISNNISIKGENNWYARVKKALTGLERYINLATMFYLGFSILTSLLVIILSTVKMATVPSHPIKRREVVVDLIYSFVILGLTGGVGLFTKLIVQLVFSS